MHIFSQYQECNSLKKGSINQLSYNRILYEVASYPIADTHHKGTIFLRYMKSSNIVSSFS